MTEADQGKLFIGGISWDTNEARLKEYFGAFGEVVEAVIMRDRTTGRARGFGFVVFLDPAAAERVVKEKHVIDGRTVEAKKAVPRDDQQLITRSSGSAQGSPVPGPGRTKKIFVGGLASSVTESDFKNYFDQFGTITDVVVMYDHVTQRPRGFGFISYDSEDAVDRVLHKTFHELNGKMVEVKRAVPKELSPGPSRSPFIGYNHSFSRANNLLNSYSPGYSLSSLGGYGLRMDGRYSDLGSTRSYGMSPNMEQGSYIGSNLGYGRVAIPYPGSNQGRYGSPIGYTPNLNNRNDSLLHSLSRNAWENPGFFTSRNNANPGSYFNSESGGLGVFGNSGVNWGASPVLTSIGGGSSGYIGRNVRYGDEGNDFAAVEGGFGRNRGLGVATPSLFGESTRGYEGSFSNLYRSGSAHGDLTWQTTSSEMNSSGSFGYGLGNFEDETAKEFDEYGLGYDISNTQSSRGIAA